MTRNTYMWCNFLVAEHLLMYFFFYHFYYGIRLLETIHVAVNTRNYTQKRL